MKGIKVPSIILDQVVNLQTATTATVRLVGRLSLPFATTSGMRLYHGLCQLQCWCPSWPTLTMLMTSPCLLTNRINIQSLYLQWKRGLEVRSPRFLEQNEAQNLSCGLAPCHVAANGNTIDHVQGFTNLGSIQQ